jgi:hypothetical protein
VVAALLKWEWKELLEQTMAGENNWREGNGIAPALNYSTPCTLTGIVQIESYLVDLAAVLDETVMLLLLELLEAWMAELEWNGSDHRKKSSFPFTEKTYRFQNFSAI